MKSGRSCRFKNIICGFKILYADSKILYADTCEQGLNRNHKSNQTTIEQTKANPNKRTAETAEIN